MVCAIVNFQVSLKDLVMQMISDSDEIKSTSGYVFIFSGSTVSWKSTKQTCITRSIMEVELIALENVSFEAE